MKWGGATTGSGVASTKQQMRMRNEARKDQKQSDSQMKPPRENQMGGGREPERDPAATPEAARGQDPTPIPPS